MNNGGVVELDPDFVGPSMSDIMSLTGIYIPDPFANVWWTVVRCADVRFSAQDHVIALAAEIGQEMYLTCNSGNSTSWWRGTRISYQSNGSGGNVPLLDDQSGLQVASR